MSERGSVGPVRLGQRILIGVAMVIVLAGFGVGGAAAEAGGELFGVSGVGAVATLVAGTVVLMVSVEVLIRALVRTAVRYRVSAFLLAVVFSGIEFDNLAFGVATGFREMQSVAFGLAIGNAISIFGLTLALGAVLVPFTVDIPRDYIALVVGSVLGLFPVLLVGEIGTGLGLALVGAYVVLFAYVFRRERAADRTFFQSREVTDAITVADGDRAGFAGPFQAVASRDWFWPLVMLVALGGIVIGAEASATGVEGILTDWNIEGSVLGLTLVTLLYTIDDLLLVLEPLRLGYEDVAMGGIVGSLLFFVTANVGIVAIVGDITVTRGTLQFHFPVMVGFTVLAGYFLWRGKLERRQGLVLLACYLAYLLATAWLFGTVPLPGE